MGRHRPRHTDTEERLAIAMSANALFQLLLDIIFEALHLIPTRVNHLSLTFLNAFISFKTLSAIHKNRFSFLHEDCQILWWMEICLIVGDVYYAIFDEFSMKFIYVRLIFIVCSLFNFIGVSYIMIKYQLWSLTYKGHGPTPEPVGLGEVIRRLSLKKATDETSTVVAEKGTESAVELPSSVEDSDVDSDDDMDAESIDGEEPASPASTITAPPDTYKAIPAPSLNSEDVAVISANREDTSGMIEIDGRYRSTTGLLSGDTSDV